MATPWRRALPATPAPKVLRENEVEQALRVGGCPGDTEAR